ncbi:MAG: hypothetical protein CMJ19_20165 [Phycisphaeraceae bacterium]|nr:hypothetical protein [Phycisphaeraceae bacterium]
MDGFLGLHLGLRLLLPPRVGQHAVAAARLGRLLGRHLCVGHVGLAGALGAGGRVAEGQERKHRVWLFASHLSMLRTAPGSLMPRTFASWPARPRPRRPPLPRGRRAPRSPNECRRRRPRCRSPRPRPSRQFRRPRPPPPRCRRGRAAAALQPRGCAQAHLATTGA